MANQKRDPRKDPRAALGEALRQLRVAAGFPTQAAASAQVVGYGEDSLSKAETGGQVPADELYGRLLALYEVTDREKALLDVMLASARAPSGPIPEFIELYLRREEEAEFLRLWSIILVPGLLQIRDYALAMYDLPGIDQDQAAATVDVRMQRQVILDRPDTPEVIAVLDESVLYRLIGTPEIMVRQIDRLLEMSQRPNVTIQVARGTGAYWGLVGSFSIASHEGAPDTLLMYAVEDQTMEDRTLTRKAAILFEKIRGHALNVGDSRAVLMEAREHWNSQQ